MIKIKKFPVLIKVTLAFGILLPNLAFSQAKTAELCQVTPVTSKKITQRSLKIRLRPAQEVTIIGHDHGTRDFDRRMEELLTNHSRSNEEFAQKIASELVHFQRAALQSAEDLEFLKSYLKTHEVEHFVGYEATQKATENNQRWAFELKKRVEAELLRRKISSSSSLQNLLVLAAGAILYTDTFTPEKMKSHQVKGVEDDAVVEQWRKALEEKRLGQEAIRKFVSSDPDFFKTLASTEMSLESSYSQFNYNRDASTLIETVSKNSPDHLKLVTDGWIKGIVNEMKWRQERDRATAEKILGFGQSGVVIIGKSHMQRLGSLLQQNCLQNQ